MAEKLSIRFAQESDIKRVFNLSNDSIVRENSINKDKISWENHVVWYKNRIKNIEEPFYIIETLDGNFVAQIRFDKENEGFVISVSIDKNFRGKGLGAEVIEKASKKLNNYPIIAYVKTNNITSQKSFIKAGYQLQGEKTICNEIYLKYTFML